VYVSVDTLHFISQAGVKRELDAVKREDKKKTELQKVRSKNPGNAHQIVSSHNSRLLEYII
jgi:hypothetical protein